MRLVRIFCKLHDVQFHGRVLQQGCPLCASVHSGQRPHACATCRARFTQLGHMKRHQMVLHDRRCPHCCLHCGGWLRNMRCIRKHLRAQHWEEGEGAAAEREESTTLSCATIATAPPKRVGLRQDDLTLTINTDGSPVFKSSKMSVWPIQFTLHELPPASKFKHRLLAGFWFRHTHPNLQAFLKDLSWILLQ